MSFGRAFHATSQVTTPVSASGQHIEASLGILGGKIGINIDLVQPLRDPFQLVDSLR
jgi:hypothetical protein